MKDFRLEDIFYPEKRVDIKKSGIYLKGNTERHGRRTRRDAVTVPCIRDFIGLPDNRNE